MLVKDVFKVKQLQSYCNSREEEALRVEVNLPGTTAACAICYSNCITRKCLTLKMKIKNTDFNIYNGAIRLWISTSTKVMTCFCDRFHRLRYINVSNLWLWKLRSRSRSTTFAIVPFDGEYQPLYLTVFEIYSRHDLENGDHIHEVHRSRMASLDGEYGTSFLTAMVMFYLSSLWPWKCRSMSRSMKVTSDHFR